MRASTIALLVLAPAGALGCGTLLHADEYGVGGPADPAISDSCGADELLLRDGSCTQIGVETCGAAFDRDQVGGCVARLPATACPTGQFAYPGKVSCARPTDVACPGDADPVSFSAVYADARHFVWHDYAGTDSDGTPARPWTTIGAALAHAMDGEQIVVSSGVYAESVHITRPVQLVGVCPERVSISGAGPDAAAVVIEAGGAGSRLRALALTGAGAGLRVLGAGDVQVRGLIVYETGGRGLDFAMTDPRTRPTAVVTETLVDRATGAGIHADGYELTIEKCMVRATREDVAHLAFGCGVSLHPGRFVRDRSVPSDVLRGKLVLRQSLIEANRDAGVRVEGSEALIEQTVVRDMLPSETSPSIGLPATGYGIDVLLEVARGLDVPVDDPVVVRQSVIEGVLGAGVRAWKASVRLEDSVVRDVGAAPGGACAGHALRVVTDRTMPVTATAVSSLFERTREAGVHVLGGAVVLERTIVRDTQADACGGRYGDGLAVYSQPFEYAQGEGAAAASLTRSKIEASARAAVASFGGSVKLDSSTLEGGTEALLAAPSVRAESEPTRAASYLTPSGSLCGTAAALRPCEPTLQAAAESALLARDPQGSVLPTVTREGKPFAGGEQLDEYVFWVLGRDEIPASVTDTTGVFRHPFVPAEAQLVLAVSRAGLAPNYFAGRTSTLDSGFDTGLGSLRGLTENASTFLGSEFDFSLGQLIVDGWDATGLVVDVQPASGTRIVYMGADGLPVPAAQPQRTTSSGFAYVYGAAPGLFDLGMTSADPALKCSPDTLPFKHGLPTTPEHARVPAFPGVWSVSAMRCVVPAPP